MGRHASFFLPWALLSLAQTVAWKCNNGQGTTTSAALKLKRFDESYKDRDAAPVCNDGTPSGYYFLEGKKQSRMWLIYLSGGGWCYDEASCKERAQSASVGAGGYNGTYHTSSSTWEDVCYKSGLFDMDTSKNPLAEAHKVYVPYCTSDAHMGSVSATKQTFGWHFQGQNVVKAVIQDVMKTKGLGSQDGDIVIFGGGSAGGRGALAHSDTIASKLPSNIQLLFLFDSPLFMDVSPFDSSSFVGFQHETKSVFDLVDVSALVPNDCGLLYKGEEWKCIFGQYRMQFVKGPYILFASQYDSWQLPFDLSTSPNQTSPPPYVGNKLFYAELFGELSQSLMRGLPSKIDFEALKGQMNQAIYSPACYSHHISEGPRFFTDATSDGVTEAVALTAYLKDINGGHRWVDHCQGFNCGAGCPAV